MLNCRKIFKNKHNRLIFKRLIDYLCTKFLISTKLFCFYSFSCNFQGEAVARRASVRPCEYGLQGFLNLRFKGFGNQEVGTAYAIRPLNDN